MDPKRKPLIVYKRCGRISNLPDPILCHILSFLPTKYSVRTSALSTRWKLLYTQVPILDFDDSLTTSRKPIDSNFINFVHSVFNKCREDLANVSEFNLKCTQRRDMSKDFHRWISAAIRLNVRKMLLNVRSFVKLPLDTFNIEMLVELKVQGGFFLTLSDSIWFPSLKTFHLVNVTIHMERSGHLCFSSCMVLEDLCLDCGFNCYGSSVLLDISLSSLKRLKLQQLNTISHVVIDTPALEFLSYHCSIPPKISGNVLESLARAEIGFRTPMNDADVIQNLLKMVSNVHSLYLFDHSMKALTGSELTRYQNLTHLELMSKRSVGWNSLLDLLESSPNIEYLILENVLWEANGEGVEIDHVLRTHEFECLSVHLKEVEFKNFFGGQYEFKLVEYFLNNAKVLNKMIICFSKHLESGYTYKRKKLQALPRYSRDCLIVVR